MITGNVIGGVIKTPGTIILRDEYGNEYTTVTTGEEVELTATTNDVRLGKTVALSQGVREGEKKIPAYYVAEGRVVTLRGEPFTIPLAEDQYDFTRLQAIICPFSSNLSNSVSAEKVCIDEKMYTVASDIALSNVTRNDETKSVDLGIINDTEKTYVIRYFSYKEEY